MVLVQCAGCSRSFPYRKGKRFHSDKCKVQFHRREKVSTDTNTWECLPEWRFSEQELALDERTRVRTVIEQQYASGARFYRLGCPQPAEAGPSELRWFPYPLLREDSLFRLDPYEAPLVPHQGHYVLATFDANQAVLCPGLFKIPILDVHFQSRWSLGTRFVEVLR